MAVEYHRPVREGDIDLFKGILVFGMVFAHVLQFFVDLPSHPDALWISTFLNIISFSGFVFCYGYVFQSNYLQQDLKVVYPRILRNSFKLFVAFVISAACFRALISHQFSRFGLLNILLLQDIPNYSEFLISFALLIFLSLFLFRLFQAALKDDRLFWGLCLVLLLTTFIPYDRVTFDPLGLLIGTKEFACFPVLQYMPFYLLGMYFSRNKIALDARLLVLSILASAVYVLFILIAGKTPERFPPSIYWIVSPMFYLYLIYLGARWYVRRGWPDRLVENLGRNVLFCLLASNIFIFAVSNYKPNAALNTLESLALALAILALASYLIWIVSPLPGTGRQQKQLPP